MTVPTTVGGGVGGLPGPSSSITSWSFDGNSIHTRPEREKPVSKCEIHQSVLQPMPPIIPEVLRAGGKGGVRNHGASCRGLGSIQTAVNMFTRKHAGPLLGCAPEMK